jgi:hypothetical protein
LNVHKNNQGVKQTQEKFVDTKRIIISRKSKDRQYNGQKKKRQNRNDILFTQITFKIYSISKRLKHFIFEKKPRIYLILIKFFTETFY